MTDVPISNQLTNSGRSDENINFNGTGLFLETGSREDLEKVAGFQRRSRFFHSWKNIYLKATRELEQKRKRGEPCKEVREKVDRLHFINKQIADPGRLIGGVVKASKWARKFNSIEKADLRMVCYETIFADRKQRESSTGEYSQLDWWKKVEDGEWTGKVSFKVVLYQTLQNAISHYVRREGYFISRHSHQANIEKKIKSYLKGEESTLRPFAERVDEIAAELNLTKNQVKVFNARLRKKRLVARKTKNNNRTPPSQDGWKSDLKTTWEQVERMGAKAKLKGFPGKIREEKVRTKRTPEEIIAKPLQHAKRVRNDKDAYRFKWLQFIQSLLGEAKDQGKINGEKYQIAKKYMGGLNQEKIAKIFHLSQSTIARRIKEVNDKLERKIRQLMNKSGVEFHKYICERKEG